MRARHFLRRISKAMKLKYGEKTIKLNSVQCVRRVGRYIACITFKNGDTIKVVCGVDVPNRKVFCFSGTVEALKSVANSQHI